MSEIPADTDALFDTEPLRVSPPVTADLTPGERLRRRQAARIASGQHPLSLDGRLRLHPDAPRVLTKEDAAGLGDYPSCGTCVFRQLMGGHARDFPKCVWGETSVAERGPYGPRVRIDYPRATHGAATDVRAWWPACETYQERP